MARYPASIQWPTERLNRLWTLIFPTINHDDLAHDWLHVYRVTKWTIRIAESQNESIELSAAAGMLHDIINVPKESDMRTLGGELSAQAGVQYLQEVGFYIDEIQEVTTAIYTCSWSSGKPPVNSIGMILQDADRLDAIGALGLLRNIACAQAMRSRGNPGVLYHPERPVPWNTNVNSLNDKEYAIDHFFRKLLLLKNGMHTALAKQEANIRHAFMLTFLENLEQELI